MELNFKTTDDESSQQTLFEAEAYQADSIDSISEEIGNFFVYHQKLVEMLPFLDPDNVDENESAELCRILESFNSIFYQSEESDLYSKLSQIFNEQLTIELVIATFIISCDEQVIIQCLILFTNYYYAENSLQPFLKSDDFAVKLITSINSPTPQIRVQSRNTMSNFLLDHDFFEMYDFDFLYKEFLEIQEEATHPSNFDEISPHFFFIRFLYAMLKNDPSNSPLFDHIEQVTTIFLLYYETGNDIDEPDIPSFTLKVLKFALTDNVFIRRDDKQKVLSLFTEDLIRQIGLVMNANELIKDAADLLQLLYHNEIDVSVILNDYEVLRTLEIVLQNKNFELSEPRVIILQLIWYYVMNRIREISLDLIKIILEIDEFRSFAEKHEAVKILSALPRDDLEPSIRFEIFSLMLNYCYTEDLFCLPSILEALGFFLFEDDKCKDYLLENADEMEQLHKLVTDPNILADPRLTTLAKTIDDIMICYSQQKNSS